MNTANTVLVNNTCADVSKFDSIFIACVTENKSLPEELADLFTLEVITVNGSARGILNFA
jgi:hypothetical protein